MPEAIARGDYEEVYNGEIKNFASDEYKPFIEECQAWMSTWSSANKMIIGSVIAMVMLIAMGIFGVSIIARIVMELIPLAVIAYAVFLLKTLNNNKIDVQYSFEVTPNPYTDLQELFEHTPRSAAMWSAKSIIHNVKSRANAGATSIVDLKGCSLTVKQPKFLNTNIKCYCLDLPNEDLYVFPDKVIFVRKDKVGAVNVTSINILCTYSDFRWNGEVPSDTVVTGYSWQYVNNNGSPDRRYKDNRQVPICKFGYLEVTSPEGINILIYTSNYDKAAAFYNKWCSIRDAEKKRTYEDLVRGVEKGIDEDAACVNQEVDTVDEEKSEREEFFSYSGKAFVLNTDYKNESSHHDFMIEHGVAAAYGTGYKEKISKIEERDLVFLYQSGVGIVAFGLASRNLFQNEEEDMIAIQLTDYHRLITPMTAATIKQTINFSFPFVLTMFPVRAEHVKLLIPILMKDYLE